MTLGEKLKSVLAAEERRKQEALRKEEDRQEQLRAELRSSRMQLVHEIKNSIIKWLNVNKVPIYKIRGTERKAWVNQVNEKRAIQDEDLWDGLVNWLEKEGLRINIQYGHDGMGNEDWLIATVELIPEPEYEAN